MTRYFFILLLMAASLAALGCVRRHGLAEGEIRIGFFPNLTHAQALVGFSRGDFQRALEPLRVVPRPLNAGPHAIEALLVGELDLVYVGSGPAINAFARSGGRALRVVGGVASGGAALVVRKDSGIMSAGDLSGTTLATPAIGNTQDISLRTFLRENGLKPRERGGKVRVVSMANPEILNLMRRGDVHGAWVPEPWATRLVHEAGGRRLIDERDLWPDGRFASAVLVASQTVLGERPDVVKQFLRAHVEVTRWIVAHPEEAQEQVNQELARLLGQPLPIGILEEAFTRLEVTYDPIEDTLLQAAGRAQRLGFLGSHHVEVAQILDLSLLHDVLAEEVVAPASMRHRGND